VLLSRFGIYCTKYDRSREPREELFKHTLPDGSVQKYGSDGRCYELSITGSAVGYFASEIGFTQDYKTEKLNNILINHKLRETSRLDEIVSIDFDGEEETFCLTIEPTHRMCANGITISNCGEQWLLPNEACTLGHHNLAMYVKTDVVSPNWEDRFDWRQYEEDIYWGVRFLDNVIELNHYATAEIEKMHRDTNRKIGLGVMGFADMLIMLGIPYASEKARVAAEKIASFHRKHADLASFKLGKERGSFGSFEGSEVQKEGWSAMRNACRTTVAPTGTTAMIAGCSTSIEPVFGLLLRREQAGMIMYESHPLFESWLNSLSESKRNSVYEYYFAHNSLMGCLDVPEDVQQLFVQANDIHHKDHVLMQAVWQKHIDNSISKTINLPNSATEDDIRHAYILAWQNGCKGITVYRDGCRSHQALSTQKKADTQPQTNEIPAAAEAGPIEENIVANYSDAGGQLCPECNQNTLEMGGGCESCKSCGFSVCHIS
jgi:ribonucleoside-diphosphate reductase alpha chain